MKGGAGVLVMPLTVVGHHFAFVEDEGAGAARLLWVGRRLALEHQVAGGQVALYRDLCANNSVAG